MRSIDRILFIILLVFSVSACVKDKFYTPAPNTHQLDEVIEFSGDQAIQLINVQTSEEEQLYHKQSKSHANYRKWTDVAIQIIDRELKVRGFEINNEAAKTLEVSIESILTETGWTQIQTRVIMNVSTGGGYSTQFVGRNHSVMAANLERQADGAVMRVVAAMLSDPEIVEYLTN